MKRLGFAAVVIVMSYACAKKDNTQQPEAAYPQQQGYPQQGYNQYPQGGYPQGPQGQAQYGQGGYTQPPQSYPPQSGAPGPAPQVPQGAPATQMATPGPLALPCQNDQGCGLAKCNTQYGKCAFPCLSQVDCAQGASCNTVTGFCLPGGGQ